MNQRVPAPMQRQIVEWGGGHRGGGDSLEWVIFALLLVLILLAIAQIALILMRRRRFGRHFGRGMHGPPGPGGPPWGRPDPLSIARTRYARGEIGRDEYVQLEHDLGGAPEPPPAYRPARAGR
jgi:uncharacterized membrane protein